MFGFARKIFVFLARNLWSGEAVENPDREQVLQIARSNIGDKDTYLEPRTVGDSLPTGLLAPFAGSYEPIGWLLCDGRTLSRVTYGALFGIIGTVFGVGDGSTTFNLPDFRNRFLLGSNALNESGGVGGEPEVTLSIEQMPAHHHTVQVAAWDDQTTMPYPVYQYNISYQKAQDTDTVGGSKPHNNMPPYIKIGWIIKAV